MKHILIADDNVAVATFVARALPNYKITTAHNGLEALVLARTLPECDLLITDYVMPALSGEQVAARLKTDCPSVKTLLMTGHSANIHTSGEMDGYLEKPFRLAVLREKVEALIGQA